MHDISCFILFYRIMYDAFCSVTLFYLHLTDQVSRLYKHCQIKQLRADSEGRFWHNLIAALFKMVI